MYWGLLGPEVLSGVRRTRTLEVGAAVRSFNDLAVPGLGGVYFGKQIFLALAGVAVAEKVRQAGKPAKNIETANAIEAMACWLALKGNGWKPDIRLKGSSKLHGKSNPTFNEARRFNFYVTQPMRMSTVQTLPALGLVETASSRFNSFVCSQHGWDLIDAASQAHGSVFRQRDSFGHLVGWALGKPTTVTDKPNFYQAVAPLEPLARIARDIVRERLLQGGAQEDPYLRDRRQNALLWMDKIISNPTVPVVWENKPSLINDDHWRDLQSGALFFRTRDLALVALECLEDIMGNSKSKTFPLSETVSDDLAAALNELRKAAEDYLDMRHSDQVASKFCSECTQKDDSELLRSLVVRDDRVLRLRGDDIAPGGAFKIRNRQEPDPTAEDPTPETAADSDLWPEGISYRIGNLFLLNLDLHGKLDEWLAESSRENGEDGNE